MGADQGLSSESPGKDCHGCAGCTDYQHVGEERASQVKMLQYLLTKGTDADHDGGCM